ICKEPVCGWMSQDVVVGRRDRGECVGRNVSRARMWFEVGETGDCMVEVMCKKDRVWLEVGKTEDCMLEAMCTEPGC
ncbi:hypothetical protein LSAT2_004380, partial [Lamellibrachia satsuma]